MNENLGEKAKDPSENIREIVLKAGIRYSICTCGTSKTLPYCDNSHRILNEQKGTSYKSLKIIPKEDITIEVFSSNWRKE